MVGFNRKCAPLAIKLKKLFQERISPMVSFYVVNWKKLSKESYLYQSN